MGISHAKVSGKSDGGDATLVLPSDWNAQHIFTGVSRVAAANLTIPASSSLVVSCDYEISSGIVFEVAASACMEIL